MKLYPESASAQLEFDKVKALLRDACEGEYGKAKAGSLRIHTQLDFIMAGLRETSEYKLILDGGQPFPNDPVLNVAREIRLLGIAGSMLSGEDFLQLKTLAEVIEKLFRWFDAERRQVYSSLWNLLSGTHYEKAIVALIDEVLDEQGHVLDSASPELRRIRTDLDRRRAELRRVFSKVLTSLAKMGYTADIAESFSNGRRVVAVQSEYKRMVKGILHGESDSGRTAYIEPGETIALNNDVFSLEQEERKEVSRILQALTGRLGVHHALISRYSDINGEYDLIRAKGRLAQAMHAALPKVSGDSRLKLRGAVHPLLFLYNRKAGRETVPLDLSLDEQHRILVISGPNAGGKTVAMKTAGLLQMMLQSGLLIPVHPDSEVGIFSRLMIHIGDTQSLEFDLSTYSSHLLHMKYFVENANGRTLFFIDELGSGTDPNLGGSFAEVILEELLRRKSFGIVTTHYLNLKVMASHTPGIINGAMAFDEKNLQPLYRLITGKPGSSYTFAIAERIGLPAAMIRRAQSLVNEDQFRLDKLLDRTEKGLQQVMHDKKELERLIKENERLRREMETVMDKERHRQQVEIQRERNRVSEEKLAGLRESERKLRQILSDWRKAEDKSAVIPDIQRVLFPPRDRTASTPAAKKIASRYTESTAAIGVGARVRMKKNYQVGEVREIRGKRAIVQIGQLPMNVDIADLVVLEEKPAPGKDD